MQGDIKFTFYIPPLVNEQLEFLRFKTRLAKNTMVLKALEDYLAKEIKRYPEFKELKNE